MLFLDTACRSESKPAERIADSLVGWLAGWLVGWFGAEIGAGPLRGDVVVLMRNAALKQCPHYLSESGAPGPAVGETADCTGFRRFDPVCGDARRFCNGMPGSPEP